MNSFPLALVRPARWMLAGALMVGILGGVGPAWGQDYAHQSSVPQTPDSRYDRPQDVALSLTDSVLYVADRGADALFRYDLTTDQSTRIRSVHVNGSRVRLQQPVGLHLDPDGTLYVADRGRERIFALRDDSTRSYAMGRGGGRLGRLDDIRDVTVDEEGHTYALDRDQQYVPYFNEDGRYLSWIRGAFRPFDDLRAIGQNGANELYTLEGSGASVTIFGPTGTVAESLGRLNSRSGVSIDNPADLAVLPGGDFLVLDQSDGRVTHFSRSGTVIGTFGTRGRGGPGTFRNPVSISVSAGTPPHVAVLDAEARQVQYFRVPARPDTLTPKARKMGVRGVASNIAPFRDLERTEDGHLYYIPRANPSSVAGTEPDGTSRLIREVDEAKALAVGPSQALYVLDSGSNTIRQFGADGALVREFGGSAARALDEPSDIAVLPNGQVLVSDQGTGLVQVWSGQGTFQRILSASSALEAPAALAAPDTSHLFAWDRSTNQLLRMALGDGRAQSSTHRLRTADPTDRSGEIVGLEADPLGHLHVYNASTHQLTVLDWSGDEPVPLLRYGRRGEGPDEFEDVEGLGFDDQNFVAHLLNDDGDEVRSVRLSVRPPAPSDSIRFTNRADTLLATVPPLHNPAVVGYSLLRYPPQGAPDTVSTRAAPRLPLPADASDTLSSPGRYALVSRSPTTASSPTRPFTDYFGYASAQYAQGRYDAALRAYRRAADSMALSDTTLQFIARRYTDLGRTRAEQYEIAPALRYIRAARRIAPRDTAVTRALGFAYSQRLRRLANEERYDSLRTVADTLVARLGADAGARQPVLSFVDSVAATLQNQSSPSAREHAVSFYERLRAWTDTSARSSYRLASAQRDLYQAKRRAGAPSYEQDILLDDALETARATAKQLSPSDDYYHETRLLQLDLLMARAEYPSVEKTATQQLSRHSGSMSDTQEANYRELRAQSYRKQEKYEPAIRAYKSLTSAHPDVRRYKVALADVLVANGSYAGAKDIYQRLRRDNPDDARLIALTGRLELERGNFAEASRLMEKALEMNPNLDGVRGDLAEAYDGAANYSKAIESYQAAIQQTRQALDSTRARRTVASRSDLEQRLATHLKSLGRVYKQLGRYGEAADVLEDLTDQAPSDATAWHSLGQAYMQSGRVHAAIDALNRARNLDQTSESITQSLTRAQARREEIVANRPPVEIVETTADELFPSLYRNYGDPSSLPIGTVVLANNTRLPKKNVSLSFHIEGLMDEPTEQTTKPLPSYSNTTIPLAANFTPAILEVTSERTVQGRLTLTYRQDGEAKTVETTVPITLHGRNAIKWKDLRRLAAFVPTRDKEMIDYAKAIDRLFRDAPSYDLPDKVVTALQVYTVMHQRGYTYSVDPQTDFSKVSQNPEMLDYCQFAEETMQRQAGDCDDLVTLYLSVLAGAGVSTGYVDLPGHVMSAINTGLSPGDLANSGLSRENVVVTNDDEVWIPVETTLLGTESFLTAWERGIERYRSEQEAGNFPEVISLQDAREIYEPASFRPDSFTPSLPADTSAILSAYEEQASALYTRHTAARRAQLRQRLEAEPDNTVARNQLGLLYARGGQLQKAHRLYEKGLDLAPSSDLLLNNYANVLYQMERYEDAIAAYKRSLDSGPEDPEVYMNLCKAQLAVGRRQAAANSYQTAIQKDSSLAEPYSYLREQL